VLVNAGDFDHIRKDTPECGCARKLRNLN